MRAAIFTAALALAACAGPTPYQPAATLSGAGYSSEPLAENTYRVRFEGNGLTERGVVESYLLRRAAEVTLEAGGTHFRFLERDVEKTRRRVRVGDDEAVPQALYADGQNLGGFGGFDGYHYYGQGTAPGGTQVGELGTPDFGSGGRYEAEAVIEVLGGTEDEEGVLDAREVLDQMGEA